MQIPPLRFKKTRQRLAKLFALGGIFLFFSLFTYSIRNPKLPSEEAPLLFYSNHSGDDLKRVYLSSIHQAKDSLFLQIYGLTDPQILSSLQKAPPSTKIFYDPSGSPSLQKELSHAIPIQTSGLMHKKILIIDKKLVLLGTANLTPTSLCMHDNLVVGLYSEELAHFLESSLEQHLDFMVGGHKAELWHLPDFQGRCLKRLLHLIQEAKSSIQVALFTFTHPKILDALAKAQMRGIQVEVALDYSSVNGSSQKAAEFLTKEGIPLLISSGGGKLFHHKWALIDKKILLVGSANWTKSAFAKNEDCILILHNLNKKQEKHFTEIWKDIQWSSLKKR